MRRFPLAHLGLRIGATATLLIALVVNLVGAPLTVGAEQAGKVYRLGFLHPTMPYASSDPTALATRIGTALAELGYVEGQNLVVERRYAEGKTDRLPGLARDLVERKVDVIVAVAPTALQAAAAATTKIPIIMFTSSDPVVTRLAASLARPGGNVTGVLIVAEGTLAGKRLQVLKEAVPGAARIAFLAPEDPGSRPQIEEAQRAATSLGIGLVVVQVRGGDYDHAFATVAAEQAGALFVAATTYFMRDRKQIIDLAARHRLPAIYEWREQVEDGGLMAYGSSLSDLSHRVAAYADRIFKGAKPGNLPVEQPTKFELVINLKTAKALGLTIPQSILIRADAVIQ